jgi:uncharacterized NAD(P)/FAD-binding protein YdhS
MKMEKEKKHFAIVGGGPSGLFMYKRLIESNRQDFEITVFEKKEQLGAGMPYSTEGANDEHVTNVSDNEIPEIVSSIDQWVSKAPPELLQRFSITPKNFNEYKVLPRLFFGVYLSAQFNLLLQQAKEAGIETYVQVNSEVADLIDRPKEGKIAAVTNDFTIHQFDCVIICTGHSWPRKHEGLIPRYFDSPYPPSKLALKINYPVAIKGSSLTAIDAIRTLSRQNGKFIKGDDEMISYLPDEESKGFKIVMHSLNGLLPAIRFHLEDSHLSKDSVLNIEEAAEVKAANDGFIPLDFLFERNFKDALRQQDPEFYEMIKDMRMEDFVESMMSMRERIDPFVLFKAEYAEAEKSIRRQQSVYWKEMLAVLSFAMNYPAKHLSAEDMLRLKKVLMPLISLVIAFVPQSSAKELLALYDAGILSLVPVGDDSEVVPKQEGGAIYTYTDEDGKQQVIHYKLFVDCVGQPHLSYHDFPFRTLVNDKTISPAKLKFKDAEQAKELMKENSEVEQDASGDYYLNVPGITINDNFQVLDQYGTYNPRLYIMAVPYIGGYNPDYSGLDFCEAASERIMENILEANPPVHKS